MVDAGIATKQRFAAATDGDALLGRLRINGKLRCAPPPPTGKRGRRPIHGAVLHHGRAEPEVAPDQELVIPGQAGDIRLRRWSQVHFQEHANTILDVVRVDDPAYDQPLIVGTTARELSSEEFRSGYGHRWPVETNFYVAQDSAAMEMPRAWTETALNRRISLARLSGSLLKAMAANFEVLAIGPWDLKAVPSAGRLANYLDIRASNFSRLALQEVNPRNYRKNRTDVHIKDLPQQEAA